MQSQAIRVMSLQEGNISMRLFSLPHSPEEVGEVSACFVKRWASRHRTFLHVLSLYPFRSFAMRLFRFFLYIPLTGDLSIVHQIRKEHTTAAIRIQLLPLLSAFLRFAGPGIPSRA